MIFQSEQAALIPRFAAGRECTLCKPLEALDTIRTIFPEEKHRNKAIAWVSRVRCNEKNMDWIDGSQTALCILGDYETKQQRIDLNALPFCWSMFATIYSFVVSEMLQNL